jgi:phosphatidylethanolamine-binding protein (PEBP) family uncharacterized protein
MTIAGAGGGVAGTAATTAGTTGAAGTSVAGSAAAGRSGAAGTTPTATAGTGTVTAGTGAAGTAAAGTGAAGMAATAGSSGAAAGSGGAAAGTGAMAGAGGAASGGTLGSALAYTGPFTMGMTIPTANRCPMPLGGGTGDNKSPALAWKGGPAATKSYALVLFDTMYNMLHWTLYDIPVTVNMLPEGLASGFALTTPAGAHQTTGNMGMDRHAYYGPCSSGALAGTYEYRLYALSVDKLTLTEMSTGAQAQAAIEAAKLEMVVWSAKPM